MCLSLGLLFLQILYHTNSHTDTLEATWCSAFCPRTRGTTVQLADACSSSRATSAVISKHFFVHKTLFNICYDELPFRWWTFLQTQAADWAFKLPNNTQKSTPNPKQVGNWIHMDVVQEQDGERDGGNFKPSPSLILMENMRLWANKLNKLEVVMRTQHKYQESTTCALPRHSSTNLDCNLLPDFQTVLADRGIRSSR